MISSIKLSLAQRLLFLALLVPCSALLIVLTAPFLLVSAYTPQVIHREPKRVLLAGEKSGLMFAFGNLDDPLPPEDYLIGDPNRIEKWYWRNPLHNFTFYMIGVADQAIERKGLRPEHVFNPDGGFNWDVTNAPGWIPLPFISFQSGKLMTYFGWRTSGNFGMKLTF